MIRIGGNEQISGFRRPEVFRAGVLTENWPVVSGLAIQPHDEIVVPGTRIDVGLNIELEGKVTEYIMNELVRIEGRSSLASAVVSLNLNDTKEGTGIDYEAIVEPRKLVVRMAEAAVRGFLRDAVPKFAQEYRDNVEDYLQAEAAGMQRIS